MELLMVEIVHVDVFILAQLPFVTSAFENQPILENQGRKGH
jgi:hypothetical protein